YGGMFTEGFLSTIVITSIAVYGFTVLKDAGIAITASNWGAKYAVEVVKHGLKVGVFARSYAHGLEDALGISYKFGVVFASLWVSAFALTSLDTATRLGRFAWQEVFGMVVDTSQGIWKTITNRWIASIIIAGLGVYLAWGGSWLIIWPAFSGMNQLLASIAMMTSALWAYKIQKAGTWSYAVVIPALFLWITVTLALIWFLVVVKPTLPIATITAIGVLLNFLLAYDFYLAWKKPEEEYEAAAA
ncbi:carbon starvation CstA family protein, partial [Palaeococcus sp. (in: euryarchaeotes)]